MRTTLFTGFGILAAAGTFVFLLLNGNVEDDSDDEENKQEAEKMVKNEKSAAKTIGETMLISFKEQFEFLQTKSISDGENLRPNGSQ